MPQTNEIADVIIDMIGALPQAKRGVTPETNIVRDLGLDSLAVMNFVMTLEDRFDVSIPMDRLVGIETVADLAATLSNLMGAERA
ncbi:acyl carrier protein [Azospirillum picis]|uniref:Acyl carrier protein n=1 Tax=Azospirillum picis TaxID=488438 RepID=A0ABU0MN63_9PROT|nr:acyl carrier protein [Azospirillum picis]MBP2301133.1 acyl carrier protein [Azospirillum picis]MDQ0534905.1 acyl carrier protein [Azospirillum picis]